MLKRIIPPAVFLVYCISKYYEDNEAINRLSFQICILFCLLLIPISILSYNVQVSKYTLLIVSSLLFIAILCMLIFNKPFFMASSISLGMLLVLILIKKYNKFGLSYFFRQLMNRRQEVKSK